MIYVLNKLYRIKSSLITEMMKAKISCNIYYKDYGCQTIPATHCKIFDLSSLGAEKNYVLWAWILYI